ENALSLTRNNVDVRRKATMMMYGDVYEYFWADKGGFDYADFAETVTGEFRSPTGANSVKHLVGNNSDHVAGIGAPMRNMSTLTYSAWVPRCLPRGRYYSQRGASHC